MIYNLESDKKAETILTSSQWIISLKENIKAKSSQNHSSSSESSIDFESELSSTSIESKNYPAKAYISLESSVQFGYLFTTADPSETILLYKRLQQAH